MRSFLAAIIFLFVSATSFAQADSSVFTPQYKKGIRYTFATTNGLKYSGFVINETRDFVTVENRVTRETWELKKSEIVATGKKSRSIADDRDALFGDNPHPRHYLLNTSAFLFEEGEFNSRAQWFIFDNTDYAFSENWAIGVNSLAFYPMSIGLKCAYQVGPHSFIGASASAMANIFAVDFGGPLFMGYAALGRYTQGTQNNNFTIGGGIVAINSDFFQGFVNPPPFLTVAFMNGSYCNRFAKKFAVNLEAWYLPQAFSGMVGGGFKYYHDEHTCWNLGCYTFVYNTFNQVQLDLQGFPLPYIGLNRKFD